MQLVPAEMLQRTLHIQVGSANGTAFLLDHEGKVYLVTARHVVAGVPPTGAVLQVWLQNEWKSYLTVRSLYPRSQAVDIAVFETNETLNGAYGVRPGEMGGACMSQVVWFLGYPYGISTRFGKPAADGPFATRAEAPFIKSGTLSAVDSSDAEAIIYYIDGFNNPGFSGGPILFWNQSADVCQILGVVMGYKTDSARVQINQQQVEAQVLVNTGILVGYSIQHALQAITDAG